MMISKYIGETEKNLSGLFDQAENKGWILFFDEAESLFGKRVEANTSNDRSANQQIAYLLQRLEDYNGVVILASNFESGLDEAFTRRFESMVHFPSPDADQRLQLWENYFRGQRYSLEQPELLPAVAEKFELSGGKIINVLRYCCIKAVERGAELIRTDELLYGIRRELYKDGKTVQATIQF
jgi:SpoVK/Ycf46/Vps4 family AAA+-type ATPase